MSLKPINFKQRLLADGIDAEKAVVVAKKIKKYGITTEVTLK